MSNYNKEDEKKLLADIIRQLQKENEKMKECLKWYTDESNYYFDSYDGASIYKDYGQKARDCLKDIENA